MVFLPTELLKKLGSGVRPDPSGGRREAQQTSGNFAEMIAAARAGKVRSDRPLRWEAEQDEEDDRVRAVIERALDQAEAHGHSRLLVAHGEALLSADVAQRSIRRLDTAGASVLALDADAVLFIRNEEDAGTELTDLESVESGMASARGRAALAIGWISNRSLGEAVAATERGQDER